MITQALTLHHSPLRQCKGTQASLALQLGNCNFNSRSQGAGTRFSAQEVKATIQSWIYWKLEPAKQIAVLVFH